MYKLLNTNTTLLFMLNLILVRIQCINIAYMFYQYTEHFFIIFQICAFSFCLLQTDKSVELEHPRFELQPLTLSRSLISAPIGM
jgi:hypothetical protein